MPKTALPRMQSADARLAEIRGALVDDFPLDAAAVGALRAAIADQLDVIAAAERAAALALQAHAA